MSSQGYTQAPMSPNPEEESAPNTPPQQSSPYIMSRPMSPALSRTNSGFFSQTSGVSGASRPGHYRGSSMKTGSFVLNTSAYTRPFVSRRIQKGEAEKPWISQKKSVTSKIITAIPLVGLAFGLIIVGIYGYTGWSSYDTVDFCPYWEDDFSNGLDEKLWQREVQVNGFGTEEFEWTTPYDNNSFVKDNQLHIHPSLTWINGSDGETLNLTTMGICTSKLDSECAATYNTTSGTYIPPVQSARLTTRISKSIRYGKVEVTAKLPVGDWLWPAIWMMPVESKYGAWPASGEIDIVEGRGNDRTYYTVAGGDPNAKTAKNLPHLPAGNDAITSTLHWGPESWADAYPYTTNGYHYPSSINDLTSSFHTFGMEWTPNGIRTYVDQQLTQIVYFKFPSKGFWDLGNFASNLVNPWFGGTKSTPFDQDFYLILNVAIGGTNGYFADRVGGKPWSNGVGRDAAMKQFHDSQTQWYPTWTQPDMIVDSVKMYKTCKTY